MFEKTIILSSVTARKNDPRNTPQDFTTKFDRRLELPLGKKYKVALHKLQSSYSWHNIEASRNNNLIRYSTDGGVSWKDILFFDGIYSYDDINNYIHNVMNENGDYVVVDGVNVYDINIEFSLTSFLVSIILTNGYQLDLTSQAFSNLLGFDVSILTTSTYGSRLPDITNSIENVFVHCSLVTDSIVDGKYGDVLYTYSTATLRRSYSYEFQDYNLVFNPMIGASIDSITMRTTDVNNRPIDFNGIDVQYQIIIREDN